MKSCCKIITDDQFSKKNGGEAWIVVSGLGLRCNTVPKIGVKFSVFCNLEKYQLISSLTYINSSINELIYKGLINSSIGFIGNPLAYTYNVNY